MKPGIDPKHFAGMRKSRNRRFTLKGDLDGFRAAKHVWTCAKCLCQTRANPYRKPYTRAKPQTCNLCQCKSWLHSDSQSEADRYAELVKTRGILWLEHPPKPLEIRSLTINGEITVVRQHRVDFRYQNGASCWIYEDHKPHNRLTELQKFIHTLVWYQHGIDVLITWYTGSGRNRRIKQEWASKLR